MDRQTEREKLRKKRLILYTFQLYTLWYKVYKFFFVVVVFFSCPVYSDFTSIFCGCNLSVVGGSRVYVYGTIWWEKGIILYNLLLLSSRGNGRRRKNGNVWNKSKDCRIYGYHRQAKVTLWSSNLWWWSLGETGGKEKSSASFAFLFNCWPQFWASWNGFLGRCEGYFFVYYPRLLRRPLRPRGHRASDASAPQLRLVRAVRFCKLPLAFPRMEALRLVVEP